jgi:hypothetical protein
MHHSVFKPSTSRSRVVRLVACVLLPACIPEAVAGSLHLISSRAGTARNPPQSLPASPSDALPYLAVVLPPPLRFVEPPPPAADPALSASMLLGPNDPAGLVGEIGALNQQAAMAVSPASSSSTTPSGSGVTNAATPPASSIAPAPGVPVPAPFEPSRPTVPPPPSGVAILPDPTPRTIPAEDVLIYFRYPASSPSSGMPPPSSATYQQQ